ncbi:hypothetical protein B0J12DRAFT_671116 [Macrophomina phaseolina]|uniref:Uncharacterized protein n=1 Tax=Macrophomina phaseolina TaxID=35725 RepID=A0ABQ8G452_9PEZI|nr:hypothetical protein B0J12DRAFT_671116 [Macrophomina phaseolina]
MAAIPISVSLGVSDAWGAALGATVIATSMKGDTVADGLLRAAPSTATTATTLATAATEKVAATVTETTAAATKTTVTATGTEATATTVRKVISAVAPYAVAVLAVGALGYFFYPSIKEDLATQDKAPPAQNNERRKENTDVKSNESPKKTSVEKDAESSSNGGSEPPKKDILIPLRLMEEILKKDGRKIFEKLRKATPNLQRTIWRNRNFRIDPGHTLNGQKHIKTWNLQINEGAKPRIRKSIKARIRKSIKVSTHTKLLWATFDLESPPEYEVWVRSVLGLFVS